MIWFRNSRTLAEAAVPTTFEHHGSKGTCDSFRVPEVELHSCQQNLNINIDHDTNSTGVPWLRAMSDIGAIPWVSFEELRQGFDAERRASIKEARVFKLQLQYSSQWCGQLTI
jgi:hypothetical protein